MRIEMGKLGSLLSDAKHLKKKLGKECADKLIQRLDELRGFRNFADQMTLRAGRCHELKGDRRGQFSVDLKHPKRLIFEPDHDPVPRKPDGGIDLGQVTRIILIEIADTHQ